ncbi:hypothetical protein [Streptomyces sp. NPDC057579]|uniref:hypothetical protein n=1 Tax=Streptomyces sp. NPDC057579 TaxID=3346172 RepID=UPI00369EC702
MHVPLLHRHAGEFTAAHSCTPSPPTWTRPAAVWLRWGGYDPLLTALAPAGSLTPCAGTRPARTGTSPTPC